MINTTAQAKKSISIVLIYSQSKPFSDMFFQIKKPNTAINTIPNNEIVVNNVETRCVLMSATACPPDVPVNVNVPVVTV